MSILDIFNKNYQTYTDQVYGPQGFYYNSPSRMNYNIDANKAATELISNTLQEGLGSFGNPAAAIAELAAPAFAFGASPFHDIAQAAARAKEPYIKSGDMPTGINRMYDDIEIPAGPTMSEFGRAILDEQIPTTMIQRTMGAAVPLANRIKAGLDLIGNFGFTTPNENKILFKNTVAPQTVNTDITASSAATPFGTLEDVQQGFVKDSPSDVDFPGENFKFLPSAYEDETDDLEASAIPEFKKGELKQSRGIGDLFRTLLGFAVPGASFFLNQGRDTLGGIKSLNQRLRNTDFGQSRTGAEYMMRRRERKQAERAREANRSVYESADRQGFTNDRGGFSTSRADRAGTSLGSGQFSSKRSTGRQGY